MNTRGNSEAIYEVIIELTKATNNYPTFASLHEGIAIIMEEFDELKEEVWKKPADRSNRALRLEAKQIAAMATRFMIELTEPE